MNDNIALQVRDLHVQIETDTATLDILHGISFDIYTAPSPWTGRSCWRCP